MLKTRHILLIHVLSHLSPPILLVILVRLVAENFLGNAMKVVGEDACLCAIRPTQPREPGHPVDEEIGGRATGLKFVPHFTAGPAGDHELRSAYRIRPGFKRGAERLCDIRTKFLGPIIPPIIWRTPKHVRVGRCPPLQPAEQQFEQEIATSQSPKCVFTRIHNPHKAA